MRGRLTRGNRQKIEDALSNHEKLRHSYLWNGDHGNGQQRSREEEERNFAIKFQYAGEEYRYVSNVSISRKNFYYKGSFWLNDEKRDARLFKSLLKKGE